MKRLFRLILILLLAFSSLKVSAKVLTDTEVKNIVAKQIIENNRHYTDAQMEVEVVALPFRELTLPEGKISFVVKPSVDKFLARDLEKVSVYVNNNFVKTFNVPVVIKAYQNVLVASCPISRETEITPSVVRIEKKEISNTLEYALKIDSANKSMVAKKFFPEGEIIDKRFVKYKPEILRNANVTVFFNGPSLSISTEGTALSDGTMGENICIMNKSYNKIYKGTVIGENKVLVRI